MLGTVRSASHAAIAAVALLSASVGSALPATAVPHPTLAPAIAASTARVALELQGRPLAEPVEQLRTLSALPLRVSEELASQKVTVLFTEMPLPDAAIALAAAVDGAWVARTKDGRTECVLEPTARRKERLQRERAELRAAGEERDRNVLAALENRLAHPGPPHGEPGDPPPPPHAEPSGLFPFIRALPPASLRRLVTDANVGIPALNGYALDKSPQLVLPGAWLPAAARAPAAAFLRAFGAEWEKIPHAPAGIGEAYRTLALHLEAVHFELWGLRATWAEGTTTDVSLSVVAPQSGWQSDFPLVVTGTVPLPQGLDNPAALAPAGAAFESPRDAETLPDILYGTTRIGRAELELARAAKVNLAADYFTTYDRFPLVVRHPTLKLARDEFGKDTFRLASFWVGNTLVFRHRDWSLAFDQEPSAKVLDAWNRCIDENRRPGLQEYLQAASDLSDAQLATLPNEMNDHCAYRFRLEAVRLLRYRHVLRAYATLGRRQREQAASADGIQLSALAVQQRLAWSGILDRFPTMPPQALPTLRFRTVERAGPLPEFQLLGVPDYGVFPLFTER